MSENMYNMLKANANFEINDKIFLLIPVTQINFRFSVECTSFKRVDYSKPYQKSIPMLSEKNRLMPVNCAKNNIQTRWEHAIFADEASRWLRPGRVRMWTKSGIIRSQPTVNITKKYTFGRLFHKWERFHCVYSRKS